MVGIALAILGITNMAGSAFMGWLMIAFAVAFGGVAWKLKKHEEKEK